MKFCIEFAYYSATLYFRATHYLCILWWPKQLQDFKSLCPIGRGQGFYHPGDGETAKEVWEERRLVLHHLVLRRWEQHWHSHHYQAGQALILCAQIYLCSGLYGYALRVIFAMSCKIQWVHVYLWIKSLMSWEFAPVCLYCLGFFPQVVILTQGPLVLNNDERMIIHLDVNHIG